jgi:hypothetical protein
MKTPKIIIVGEKRESEPKKPIEFIMNLLSNGTLEGGFVDKPTDYNYIELIARNYGDLNGNSFDLIFCYDNPNGRRDGILYLGHWNDGVAE